jgi:hypothetical protein
VRCARISIEIPIAHELVARWMAPPMFTSPTSPSQKERCEENFVGRPVLRRRLDSRIAGGLQPLVWNSDADGNQPVFPLG